MFIPFIQLGQNTQVWTYCANRFLNQSEQAELSALLQSLCEHWQSHGQDVKASFKIMHDAIIVLAVDQDFCATGGCSIDSSVNQMKQISQKMDLNLFSRKNFLLKDKSDNLFLKCADNDLPQQAFEQMFNQSTFALIELQQMPWLPFDSTQIPMEKSSFNLSL